MSAPTAEPSSTAGITQARVSPGLSLFKNDFSASGAQLGMVTLSLEEQGPHQPHVPVQSQLSLNISASGQASTGRPPCTSEQQATPPSWISENKDYPCSPHTLPP